MVLTPEKRLQLHQVVMKVRLTKLKEPDDQSVTLNAALHSYLDVLEFVAEAALDLKRGMVNPFGDGEPPVQHLGLKISQDVLVRIVATVGSKQQPAEGLRLRLIAARPQGGAGPFPPDCDGG